MILGIHHVQITVPRGAEAQAKAFYCGVLGPYLSADDALKLDNVRRALMRGDIPTATQLARIYRLTPLTAV